MRRPSMATLRVADPFAGGGDKVGHGAGGNAGTEEADGAPYMRRLPVFRSADGSFAGWPPEASRDRPIARRT